VLGETRPYREIGKKIVAKCGPRDLKKLLCSNKESINSCQDVSTVNAYASCSTKPSYVSEDKEVVLTVSIVVFVID
jgi:hypothetical protein